MSHKLTINVSKLTRTGFKKTLNWDIGVHCQSFVKFVIQRLPKNIIALVGNFIVDHLS